MSSEDLFDRTLATNYVYHLYNRGVAKQPIFHDQRDYQHLLLCLSYYLEREPALKLSHVLRSHKTRELLENPLKEPLIKMYANCLMPNHFHLVIEPLVDGGVTTWAQRAFNSYTRYFNTRHNRVGPLFQGPFRFVPVSTDEQFLHVTRYAHINPVIAKLVADAEKYPWSSMRNYVAGTSSRLCDPKRALDIIGSPERYRDFVRDHIDYAASIARIQHLLIEEE